MPIRDLGLFVVTGALLTMVLVHPYIGALMWVVFSLLNPHRLAFGPAYDFSFSLAIGIVTAIGIVLTNDHRKAKFGAPGVVLAIFTVWMCITTVFAATPVDAVPMWSRVIKTFAMTYILMLLLHTQRHERLLLGCMVLSIGFYGIKGGLFTLKSGGSGMVVGPPGSLLLSNNHLAVAIVMVIPLLLHYYQQARSRSVRWGALAAMLLCVAAVLGSYSRGAVLALGAMGLVLWSRSSHKLVVFVAILTTALILVPFMPERWDERMHTIETYETDGSALSRLNAWRTAWNIAVDRPLGAGFEYPSPEVIAKYSPEQILTTPVAHSIYFQVMGEHGFIGLFMYMLFWILVWRECSKVRRLCMDRPDFKWEFSMLSMIQAGFVGYAVGGAFINIAFWDMPFFVYALVMVTRYAVDERLAAEAVAPASGGARPAQRRRSLDGEREPKPTSA